MAFSEVGRWLLHQPERERPPERVYEELAQRLIAEGVPLWRLSTSLISFDPVLISTNIFWFRDRGAQVQYPPYSLLQGPTYKRSTIQRLIEKGEEVRVRLDLPADQVPFPVLVDLKSQGAIDYFALPLWLGDALTSARFRQSVSTGRSWISFTTDHPAGFSDAHLDGLRSIREELAFRLALETSKESARSLLRAYLGRNAARRVLEGSFQRGSAEAIRAVIWYCDMRGFTSLSDAIPPGEVVKVLDRYFDCVATPIEKHGGEVLKFIGDAVLAIIPIPEGGDEDACHRALLAAREAIANLAALRTEPGAPQLGCGVALHVGDVYYGNIGTAARLDFTVIGAAVNEVCRVEPLTRILNVDALLTEAFVNAGRISGPPSLGRHALKGVSGEREVFALPQVTSGRA
jgi:adenylate cyclase